MMSNGHKHTNNKRGSGKCNRIHSKEVAVICILSNVVLTLAFLVLIISLVVERTCLKPQDSLTCLPCDNMSFNGINNPGPRHAGSFAIEQRDNGMCCVPVKSITQMTFQMEMAKQYHYSSSSQSLIDIAEVYANCERETHDKQPIAKLVGIVEFKPSLIVNGHRKVLWNEYGATFSANNCVHLVLEGEIFVRQAGYYIVSSQLHIRPRKKTHTPMNETIPTTFIHHVDLHTHVYGTTGVLMENIKTTERNGGYFTSFLSAVFSLKEYDRLSVSVSNPELLDIDNSNDYFLVYYTYGLPN